MARLATGYRCYETRWGYQGTRKVQEIFRVQIAVREPCNMCVNDRDRAMQRECKLIEPEWIKYRDEVLSSFNKAPPAAHLFVLRNTFFAGAYSLFERIVAGGGAADRRLRLIQAELERFNAESGLPDRQADECHRSLD
jgi:hypothetical protein